MIRRSVIITLIIVSTMLIINIPSSSTTTYFISSPPTIGTWWIDSNTVMNDTTEQVNGNLTINNTGKLELINVTLTMNGNITVFGELTLKNVTLIMNCTLLGEFGISVEPGGSLYILDHDGNPGTNDGSIITSGQKDGMHCYTFRVKSGSSFRFENSIVQECGYGSYDDTDPAFSGLIIEADHVLIGNSTINRSRNGIIFYSFTSWGNTVINCTFSRNYSLSQTLYGYYGLNFYQSFDNIVEGCRFHDILWGLRLSSSTGNLITDCDFINSTFADPWLAGSSAIELQSSENNRIQNIYVEKYPFGMISNSCENHQFSNISLNITHWGLNFVNNNKNLILEDISIKEIRKYDDSAEVGVGISFYFENYHIYLANCTIQGQNNTLGFYWLGEQFNSNDYHFKNCTVIVTDGGLVADSILEKSIDVISEVLIEDSYFEAARFAVRSVDILENWTFIDCVFNMNNPYFYYNKSKYAVNLLNDARNVTFDNCDFYDSGSGHTSTGLYVGSTYNDINLDLRLDNCDFFNNSGDGIELRKDTNELTGTLIIDNCSIINNKKTGLSYSGSDLVIKMIGTNVSNNKDTGLNINSMDNTKISITNCHISENQAEGVYFYGGDPTSIFEISNSNVSRNSGNGTRAYSSNLTIRDTIFFSNMNRGLDLNSCEGTIRGNSILKNGQTGMSIKDNMDGIQVEKNVFRNNDLFTNTAELLITGASEVIINNNSFSGVYSRSLLDIEDSNVQIENNNITDGVEYGIFISQDSNVIIKDNEINRTKIGAVVEGTAEIEMNSIGLSEDSGIRLLNNGTAEVHMNTLVGNNIGIAVDYGRLETGGNHIENNKYGLYLLNAINTDLADDVVYKNEIGIYSKNSYFVVNNNSFEDNIDSFSLENSSCRIYNSTIAGSERNFKLKDGSRGWIINSEMTGGSINIIDGQSKLEVQNYLNMAIFDTDNNSLPFTKIVIHNRFGHELYNGTASASGRLTWLNLSSATWYSTGASDPNPYTVILSKNGYGTISNDLYFTKYTDASYTLHKLSELITEFKAYDTPDDQGGSITLEWNSTPILNFDHFNLYFDYDEITTLANLNPFDSSISDPHVSSRTITAIRGQPLVNGESYYFAITIVDSNGNEDLIDFLSSGEVIVRDNIIPEPVINLSAFDTPGDDGDSLTVTWDPSDAEDFSHYSLYVLDFGVLNKSDLLALDPHMQIDNGSKTTIILSGLEENTGYYISVIVYDINSNYNSSFDIIGPILTVDNTPPVINLSSCIPPISEKLEYEQGDLVSFVVALVHEDDVTYRWYLDDVLIPEATESFLTINMSDLDPGIHVLFVLVEETSGLNDSLEWNFTVSTAPVSLSSTDDNTGMILIFIFLILLVIFVVTLSIFINKRRSRKKEIRKTLKAISAMDRSQGVAHIFEKREQWDRTTLIELVERLPESVEYQHKRLIPLLVEFSRYDDPGVRDAVVRQISMLMDKSPNVTFPVLWELQSIGARNEIFDLISRELKNEKIKQITSCYYSNLEAFEQVELENALAHSAEVFKKVEYIEYGDDTEYIEYGVDMSLIYSTLDEFNNYRTVTSISSSGQAINKLAAHKDDSSPSIYVDALNVFINMARVTSSVGKYEKVEAIDDKISYLSEGINHIEDTFKIARESLKAPERDFFFLVLNSWRNIISLSIRELRGRAELNLTLKGGTIPAGLEKTTVMLEIENSGRSTAERVIVELVPSGDYSILSKPQEVGMIGQKKRNDVTFELEPRTDKAFRVGFMIHYDDAERKGKSISFGDMVTFMEIGTEFMEIPNPYIVGRPIKPGSKIFFGRKDLIDFISNNIKGALQENIIVLIGHRRTGKTTLLKQLPVHLAQEFIPVYVDIQGIIDPGNDSFFYLLASEISGAMQSRGIEIEVPDFDRFKNRPSYFFEYEFLKEVNEKLGEHILILMFDEFEELQVKVDSKLLDENIFGYMRHLMQHSEKLAFIFTGSSRLEELKTDYWSIMFNIALYKRIGFLSEEDTIRLITEPVKDYNMIYDSLALEKIYRLTSGHPYFTQLLCHALVNLHNREKKNYITVQDVNGEIFRIIERGQMHFDFIWKQSSLMARLVMTALTRLYQEEGKVTVSSIVNKLGEYGLSLSPKDISKTLDELAAKDIISKIINRTTTYEFKADLVRIWLESTKSLDQVVENYRVGL